MTFYYTPLFIRQFDDLEEFLQQEVREKIAIFQKNVREPSLRTHKLKGKLQGCFSFSVNYQYRIVFCYDKKNQVAFLEVGTHDMYR